MQHKQLVTNQALRAQTATIVIERGTTITGTLTDPDGKPVAERSWFGATTPIRSTVRSRKSSLTKTAITDFRPYPPDR